LVEERLIVPRAGGNCPVSRLPPVEIPAAPSKSTFPVRRAAQCSVGTKGRTR
jgi:hypothetical protein